MTIATMSFQRAGLVFGGAMLGSTILVTAIVKAGGATPHTITPEWRAATREYLRFQQMNPIGLGGRKAWDPEYLKKE